MNTRHPMATLVAAGIVSLLALSVGIGAVATPAQAPADAAPKFEVASIRRNTSGDGRVMLGIQRGGRFTATNVPLRLLITNAYRIQDFQIEGAPSWIATDRFDIVAKAESDIPEAQLQLLVQALLAERFKLAVHRDAREMPIYALVLAHQDGKLGPKLSASTVDCDALRAQGRNGGPPAPPPPGAMMPCGMRMGPGSLTGSAMSMGQFARTLSNAVHRVVVDKTGLAGGYDFDLSFTPEQMLGGGPGGGPAGPGGAAGLPAVDPNGPSIYTALQEQLGLKLDSQRGPVETLVIDHVEAPTVD
jgi:uncharacterized protein (TIGR03435 family)